MKWGEVITLILGVDITNGLKAGRSLITWYGSENLWTLSVEQIGTDLLNEGAYMHPIDLSAARDFSTEATIKDKILYESIQEKVSRMYFDPIMRDLFEKICPNFSNKPQAHVERVSMNVVDSDGNTITMNADSYNSRFWAAIWPFMYERVYPIDCAGQFIRDLHPDLRKKVEAVYPN